MTRAHLSLVNHGFYVRQVVHYSRAAYNDLAKQFEHATAGKPKEFKKAWVAGWVENLRKSLKVRSAHGAIGSISRGLSMSKLGTVGTMSEKRGRRRKGA